MRRYRFQSGRIEKHFPRKWQKDGECGRSRGIWLRFPIRHRTPCKAGTDRSHKSAICSELRSTATWSDATTRYKSLQKVFEDKNTQKVAKGELTKRRKKSSSLYLIGGVGWRAGATKKGEKSRYVQMAGCKTDQQERWQEGAQLPEKALTRKMEKA